MSISSHTRLMFYLLQGHLQVTPPLQVRLYHLMRLSRTSHLALRTTIASDTSSPRTQTQIDLLPLKIRMSRRTRSIHPLLCVALAMVGPGKSSRETNSVQCSPHGFCARGKLPGSRLVGERIIALAGVEYLTTDKLAMVASTVSSKMVQQMARQEGFTFVECLTGTWLRSQPPFKS